MMLKKGILILSSLFAVAFAQTNQDQTTLFTIAGTPVSVGEFTRVYTKNNINNQADFSKKSLDEYLKLYENFRLKVKEAEALGMDTAKAFSSELASYRSQLTGTYLTDRKVTENLVKEAYDRMQEEVEVSHILIFWPNNIPTKADSAKVLKELLSIRTAAQKTSFQDQVAIYNKLNTTKYAGNKQKYESGNLGYVTVFQTVYPFENAMYSTAIGQISEPVATQFGYHLVYVKNKRAARGKMETAHLLVKSKADDSAENQKIAETKAKQISEDIKSGKITFEEAVKTYSEDKKTKFQGGVLPALSGAEMLESYSNAVFALKNDGEITAPVKTELGWHIIKRIKKDELPEYDYAKNEIEKRVQKDSRSNVANVMMIADTKTKFGFSENNLAVSSLVRNYETAQSDKKPVTKVSTENSPILFNIGTKKVTESEFFSTLKNEKPSNPEETKEFVMEKYKAFKAEAISKYREEHLEEISPDFKNLMQEYHDGILLFELTNKEVWNKAVEDTTGLNKFFESNREKYVWKDRIAYTNYTAKDLKTAEKLKKYLAKGKTQDFILAKLNKKVETVSAKEFKAEKGANEVVNALDWKKASISEEKNLDGSVKITYVTDVLAPSQKTLSETRGYVISDYQDFLEAEWIKTLSQKYPITVNEEAFRALVK